MPDTNDERNVEDVLSSVRRLVSGEISGRPRRTGPPQALVLTPKQRVSEARHAEGRKSLEDRIAELESQLAGRHDEWEPDGSEDPAAHRPTEAIIRTSSKPVEREPEMQESRRKDDVFVPEEAEESPDAPPPIRSTRRLSRIELVDTASGAQNPPEVEAEFEPRAESATPDAEFDKELARAVADSVNAVIEELANDPPEVEATRENSADVASDETEDAAEDSPAEMVASISDSLDPGGQLNARLNEVGAEAETCEPEAEQPDRSADATEETRAEHHASPHSVPREGAMDALGQDLRELVAQLIREELQGELGTRITRNVRKLVRREIQRALAARDLS